MIKIFIKHDTLVNSGRSSIQIKYSNTKIQSDKSRFGSISGIATASQTALSFHL